MDDDVTSLRDHVAVLRRRWRTLAVCAALGLLAGTGLSALQDPLYEAESTVLLEPSKASASATVMDPGEVATQARVVASAPVAARVVELLDLDTDPDALLRSVTVEVLEQTRTVGITAQRSSAESAAEVADAFADEYIAFRSAAAVAAANAVRDGLITQLGTVRAQLNSVRGDLRGGDITNRRRQVLKAQERSLVTRDAELRTEISLASQTEPELPGGGQVLRHAEVPVDPVQPRPVRSAGFGLLLGLVLGVLLAYVRDRIDDGIRNEQQLRVAVGQPILGRIPQETGSGSRLVTVLAPTSPESEAYRTLTTNIRFLGVGHESRHESELLVVSSAVSGEGKTTLAANVAVSAARVGLRVLLVDADLRAPDVATRFGISVPIGLSHVLAGQASLDDAIYDAKSLDIPGLSLIAAGVVPPNPAELLAGPRAAAMWGELRSRADLVVVDSAPVLRVADALELVGWADLIMLAVRYRHSRTHEVEAAAERIRQVGGTVSGVAWCGIPQREATYGYGASGPL